MPHGEYARQRRLPIHYSELDGQDDHSKVPKVRTLWTDEEKMHDV